MLVPIEDEFAVAYNNVLKKVIKREGYSPQTPRLMGYWWMEETGHRLIYQEYAQQLCIEFDDEQEVSMFLLRWA